MFASPRNLPLLKASGLFSEADLYQARYAASLAAPEQRELVAGLTALISLAVREGHVCLELTDATVQERLRQLGLPDKDFATRLPVTGVMDIPGSGAPLLLAGSRLYFARFYHDEARVAATILRLCAAEPIPCARLAALSGQPFRAEEPEPDWQRVAAYAALRGRICVISGGPGTGKTHTVARILTLAAELHKDEPFTIRLAAPTGKAASRMTESLWGAFGGTPPEAITRCLNAEARTVHRLLGWRPSGFVHHSGNPLPVDMLIVDEASMLDLNLFARLLEALPDQARLILLGDRNQLASVEAGAVLANLCPPAAVNAFSPQFRTDLQTMSGMDLPVAASPSPLVDHVIELKKSYRFSGDSGIAALSLAIRDGNTAVTRTILNGDRPDIHVRPCAGQQDLTRVLQPLIRDAFADLGRTADPARAFACLDRLRLLSPLRHGPRGVETVNSIGRELLTGSSRDLWYPGRPVMVLENDSATKLFNGDVGIALPVDGILRVFFPSGNGYVSFAPARLPRTETCYCMTVHKSQGSEFDHAVLILPDEPCPILGRELVYTALTRARREFTLLGRAAGLLEAVDRPVRRDSGLSDALAGTDNPSAL